jgi:hypothetical protein
MPSVVVWIALGFALSSCLAKPAFHCQSDDACVSADGSRGTCEASGECVFHSALADQGGASEAGGAGPSTAGSASSAGAPSSSGGSGGHGGSAADVAAAGEADAAGAAGAPCTDEAAGNCYACGPTTSAQLLNACTSSACVPFDDHARLKNLPMSGELPPLPPASGQ